MIDPAIPRIPVADLPERYQPIADNMLNLIGDATTIQVWAHSQTATDFYFEQFYRGMFYNGNPGTVLDVKYKQLMRLRISKRHGCVVCNRNNEAEVQEYGYGIEQIDALFDAHPEAGLFSDLELAIIDFADQMILSNQDGELDKSLYDRLRKHLSDEQIVEMSLVAAVLIGVAKLGFTLKLRDREATCDIGKAAKLAA